MIQYIVISYKKIFMKGKRRTIILFCVCLIVCIFAIIQASLMDNVVWNDHNANGIQDSGEEGIAGVKVKLYDGQEEYTEETNSRGHYKFNGFKYGQHTVMIEQGGVLEGCKNTHDRDGNKDGKFEYNHTKENNHYAHANFGYNCPSKVASEGLTKRELFTRLAIITIAVIFSVIMFIHKKSSKEYNLER